MEYQKIINFLENAPNQQNKFRTRNWVEVNDESRGTYDINSQIKCKTSMLRSSLCDYSDAYILLSANSTQIDNVKDIDIVMPMYSLIEYSDNYSKTS